MFYCLIHSTCQNNNKLYHSKLRKTKNRKCPITDIRCTPVNILRERIRDRIAS
ncbi:hypothetical protein BC792_1347 [Sphingobacterium allocomposti]|uniref:Uncharacterized protein n=1 Tax=Sphingobacterium allocomposti TaxID=415956 RepID=A0A5S5CVY1_9SPHI|nr:hypothetical protein BC792_1347 [Sphingobacterium composti Yoo et al. 2007 non Ten et al. 2007]